MAIPTDFLVVGSGVAGMWFALHAAKLGTVTIVTKDERSESNSRYAQGGIAAVWADDDTFANHVRDTLVAGAGLCRPDAVQQTVREGPARIQELIDFGTQFTRKQSAPDLYSLHREGGHSHRRILHAADLTGAELVRALGQACLAEPNITILEDHIAIDLVTEQWLARKKQQIPPESDRVLGAYVLDRKADEVHAFAARVVVLAAGGAGKTYLYTTNPHVATGDGIAMGYRAGARIANMEFVQFHPTCLYHPKETSFLVSEALRGEGGKLMLPNGHHFMPDYDERADLAPRDIVARAIDYEIKRGGLESVFLDMRHLSREDAERMFPNIDAKLVSLGLHMDRDPIPVVPAAHYFCGGVQTDLWGESSITNLFAVGECSCTGLHGANRLASNSLLEAVVFAGKAAERVADRELPPFSEIPAWDPYEAETSDELVVIKQVWEEIRRFMWNYVGIVRSHRRLKRAQRRIQLVQDEIKRYYWDFKVTADLIELRNISVVAQLIVDSALRRPESRGLHYTIDFPETDDRFVRDTVLRREL